MSLLGPPPSVKTPEGHGMFRDGAETRLFKGAASPDEGDTGIGWKAKLLRRANQVFSEAYVR